MDERRAQTDSGAIDFCAGISPETNADRPKTYCLCGNTT